MAPSPQHTDSAASPRADRAGRQRKEGPTSRQTGPPAGPQAENVGSPGRENANTMSSPRGSNRVPSHNPQFAEWATRRRQQRSTTEATDEETDKNTKPRATPGAAGDATAERTHEAPNDDGPETRRAVPTSAIWALVSTLAPVVCARGITKFILKVLNSWWSWWTLQTLRKVVHEFFVSVMVSLG